VRIPVMFAADDVPHLVEQFWFVCGRHSHYPVRHDSDFALPNLKLKPDYTQNLGISLEMPKN